MTWHWLANGNFLETLRDGWIVLLVNLDALLLEPLTMPTMIAAWRRRSSWAS